MPEEYIQVRKSQFHFYENVPLYLQTNEDIFVLYKPEGITLDNMRLKDGRVPDKLYINQEDKIKVFRKSKKFSINNLKKIFGLITLKKSKKQL